MQDWELVAREAIRELVARYNALGDAGRVDEMAALFADDAVLDVVGTRLRGRAAIHDFFAEVARGKAGGGGVRSIRHFTATLVIEPESRSRAVGRCYYQVLTESGLDHWGRYEDAYRSGDGVWRFASRSVSVDGRVPGGWADRNLARMGLAEQGAG